mgnify:CR=1 FL=1
MDKDLHLKLTVRLYTDDNQRCFGPGIATLLHRVEEHHSLRAAAASMGMAYSKAWRIIRTAEGVFGCKLLASTILGHIFVHVLVAYCRFLKADALPLQHGGGAVLTEQAQRLLGAYDAYCADVQSYSQSRFEAAFGFYRDLEKE